MNTTEVILIEIRHLTGTAQVDDDAFACSEALR